MTEILAGDHEEAGGSDEAADDQTDDGERACPCGTAESACQSDDGNEQPDVRTEHERDGEDGKRGGNETDSGQRRGRRLGDKRCSEGGRVELTLCDQVAQGTARG